MKISTHQNIQLGIERVKACTR